MDLPALARDLDKLATADTLVADSYVRYALKKAALYFFAYLLAVIGVCVLGLALYWLLSDGLGKIGAATLVGLLGCVIAGIIAVVALMLRPAREFSIAMEMRRSAISALEQNVGTSAVSPSTYLHPAGEALISSALLPLIGVLIRSLKSSDARITGQAPAELDKTADASSAVNLPKA